MPGSAFTVIAHRGASGYLPEHTLAAKALAHAMEPDYIEQDVVLTQDGQAIVLHDITLDETTNVAEVFPDRARGDGRFYAIDFTLAEIRQLRVHERVSLETRQPVFPGRFPLHAASFMVPTLAEEIELIQGLNRSRGVEIGIYPELKHPAFHEAEGQDMTRIVLEVLTRYGYEGPEANCYVQCFEVEPLRRLREKFKCQLPLVQLIGSPEDEEGAWQDMLSSEGIETIAGYASGIGPCMSDLWHTSEGERKSTGVIEAAHAAGLAVHPYTLRADALPEGMSETEVLDLLKRLSADGVFTDFPDHAAAFRDQRRLGNPSKQDQSR